MKKLIITLSFAAIVCSGYAQENLTYQKPSKEILDLVDVPRRPGIRIDGKNETFLLLGRDGYKSIEELSKKELRLGGLRIDPKTNISSRASYYTNITIKKIKENREIKVTGLPEKAKIANLQWSPDYSKFAFTNTSEAGVELWVGDVVTAKARKLTEAVLNANIRGVYTWFKNGQSMLVRYLAKNKKSLIDTQVAVPTGPIVSVSDGVKAQNRTYQDLLKTPNDESNFELLATSELKKVSLNGAVETWAKADMYTRMSLSPNGEYILLTKIKKPFSYLVTYNRFPKETAIYTKDGNLIKVINDVPLDEVRPKGFMATRAGKRNIRWRSDQTATLYWAEALDKGDPAIKVPFRDEVFELKAPFNGTPKSILKTINRFSSIQWSNKKDIAFAYDYWWNTRNVKTYQFNPENINQKPIIFSDRNYQDRYSDPGDFVTNKNELGNDVVIIEKGKVYLIGSGYTKKGKFPFVDTYSLKAKATKRIYQSAYTDKVEDIYFAVDLKKKIFLTSLESKSEIPNYYFKNLKTKKIVPITKFENPFKSIQNIHKEVVKYKREDGLELTGTLYLPVGYDTTKKKKMPMILWAYPREFKDKKSASQTTNNSNSFTYPNYGSMIYWVTKGYVVLDKAAFPIIGEGDEEPNDSFRKQLVANAKAAIDAIDELGYIDRERVAVGGHSYGAFMTANLLSHSNLFAAGIARSGAYNRTLTPFGFQSEERNYWEAPEVYYKMSPFMHADKMKTPLLLIHGKADNNSGTYPLQSERYFNALKGLGATTRLVMLPKESHGYSAKESILHMLWEQEQWLDTYVKNKK
ncbi:Dipeptidyl aminopeptidase/acylaminoacyl peptidase [Tenacibaculum sp. MAR_2009_124]|uniref:S9 family peptidase n=1 Tax=Tenacibaculum sp. MAR_2009_124 TaxID=1250059 RepID=UPI0008955F76|nr:prolyl oligopeptidase family serine peptidase [Tenacibaculum sp. MAR_2009_124]SEB43712.1 Dipeptidyl aminopeptidase/acylaminoacyl peptidase [Tenacibaculum sp. MAR_2009_124]